MANNINSSCEKYISSAQTPKYMKKNVVFERGTGMNHSEPLLLNHLETMSGEQSRNSKRRSTSCSHLATKARVLLEIFHNCQDAVQREQKRKANLGISWIVNCPTSICIAAPQKRSHHHSNTNRWSMVVELARWELHDYFSNLQFPKYCRSFLVPGSLTKLSFAVPKKHPCDPMCISPPAIKHTRA